MREKRRERGREREREREGGGEGEGVKKGLRKSTLHKLTMRSPPKELVTLALLDMVPRQNEKQ